MLCTYLFYCVCVSLFFQPPRKIRSASDPSINTLDCMHEPKVPDLELNDCWNSWNISELEVIFLLITYVILASDWLAEWRFLQKTCIRACASNLWLSKILLNTDTSRTATIHYIEYSLIWELFSWKMATSFPEFTKWWFKCLVLCNQQSKIQKYSIYFQIWKNKASNPHSGEVGSTDCLTFILKKWTKQFINYQYSQHFC